MDIYEIRLHNARLLAGEFDSLAKFAEQIDRAPTQVSRFMGRNPTKNIGPSIARHIEEKCRKERGWLDINHSQSSSPEEPTSKVWDLVDIPIYDARLAAGSGSYAIAENSTEAIPFPRAWLIQNNLATTGMVIAYASGDSMTPTIKDGDTLMIDTNQTRPVADQVFAFANGDSELRVKRLAKLTTGMWVIRSDNTDPAYRDEAIAPQEMDQLHIIGRVMKVISGL